MMDPSDPVTPVNQEKPSTASMTSRGPLRRYQTSELGRFKLKPSNANGKQFATARGKPAFNAFATVVSVDGRMVTGGGAPTGEAYFTLSETMRLTKSRNLLDNPVSSRKSK